MKDKKFYKLHIFSAGTHTSASGHECTLTQDDLNNTADIFISNHRVPLCLGHSSYKKKDVLPSMGWFRAVKEEDGELYGLLEPTKAGKALLDGGYYENFSSSFYAPDSPLNPKPGFWTLRHVAALGEEPPSLKELDPMLEIIPEDFAEVQDFNLFYEFKSADAQDFEEFDDGTTFVLPDEYDFKTFRPYGKKLNCKKGLKQCGGRCIPNNWKCKDKTEPYQKKFKPGTKKPYDKSKYQKKKETTPKPTVQTEPKKPFLSKEDYAAQQKQKKADEAAAKTKKNLTVGNLKAMAGAGVLIASSIMAEKTFPDDKTSKAAAKLVGSIAAGQFVVKDDASMSDRLRAAVYDGFKGSIKVSTEAALGDNPYADTMSKATIKLMEVAIEKSGVYNPNEVYDSYAKGMMDAIDGFGSAIRDTKKYQKAQSEFKKTDEKIQERTKELQKQLESVNLNPEEVGIMKHQIGNMRQDIEDLKQQVASGAISKKKMSEGQLILIDTLDKIIYGADPESLKRDWPTILEAYKRATGEQFAETEPGTIMMGGGASYHSPYNPLVLKYANSDVPIELSRPALFAAMLPLALCILKYIGLYDDSEIKKARAEDVKAGNPQLDAIFSEIKNAKGVLNHDVTNDELGRALFGDDRLIPGGDSENKGNDFETDWEFSDNGTVPESGKRRMGRRKRRSGSRSQEFRENRKRTNSKTRNSNSRSPRKSDSNSINDLIDNAIHEAMFSESNVPMESRNRNSRRKSRNGSGRNSSKKFKTHGRDFAERTARDVRKRLKKGTKRVNFGESQNPPDIKDSQEYRDLKAKYDKAETIGRRLTVENFCEGLYNDGRLSAGWVRKNDLVNFLMKQSQEKGSFDFGEGSSSGHNDYDFVVSLLNNLEPSVSFSEVTDNDNTFIDMPRFEEGYDIQSQKMDYQIQLLMQSNPNLTYDQAWVKVAGRK